MATGLKRLETPNTVNGINFKRFAAAIISQRIMMQIITVKKYFTLMRG
jgi:hypothetical protein